MKTPIQIARTVDAMADADQMRRDNEYERREAELEAEFQARIDAYIDRVSAYEQWFCTDCGKPCEIEEVTFDYSGTHCTHGLPGTHHTGDYVSVCCGADYTDREQGE